MTDTTQKAQGSGAGEALAPCPFCGGKELMTFL